MDLEAKLRDPRLQVSEGKCPPAPDEARLSTLVKKKLPATGGSLLTSGRSQPRGPQSYKTSPPGGALLNAP